MFRLPLPLLLAAASPLTSCIGILRNPPPGGTVCTDLFAYGVSASVASAASDAPIAQATLTLREGDYSEVMQSFPNGDYVGAGERAGTYTLIAEAPGFETKIIPDIVVTADECHVHGVHEEVRLQPSSTPGAADRGFPLGKR